MGSTSIIASRSVLLLIAASFYCKNVIAANLSTNSLSSLTLNPSPPVEQTFKLPTPSPTTVVPSGSFVLSQPKSYTESANIMASSRTGNSSSVVNPVTVTSSSVVNHVMVTSSPGPVPVYEDPVVTYGDNICERYTAGGPCQAVLDLFPLVITNLTRSNQSFARGANDQIIQTLYNFESTDECINLAIPLLCRYSFPTCDPAFVAPTYQPICRRDCQAAQFFACKEPWKQMETIIRLLNLQVIDQPDCDPLKNPNGGDAPMCVSTVDTYRGEIPLPLQTGPSCYSGHGRGYNGTINVTSGGRPCQRWDLNYPHQHLLGLEDYPELDGGHNYCRNPGERGDRPWCFTTDPEHRWDYCDIPECSGPTCENYMGEICRTNGTTGYHKVYIDKFRAGHAHPQADYEETMIRLLGVLEGYRSECRSIFAEFLCATNFPRCDLTQATATPYRPCRKFCERVHKECEKEIDDLKAFHGVVEYDPLEIIFNCSILPDPTGGDSPDCYEPVVLQELSEGSDECYSAADRGFSYKGTISVTSSGKQCQLWSSQSPHYHTITPLVHTYLKRHNFCRNPEQRGERPWCYTSNPDTRWEYCNVPICGVPPTTEPTGTLSQTIVIILSIVIPVVVVMLAILAVLLIICLVWCCSRSTTTSIQMGKEPDSQRYVPNVQMVSMYPTDHKDIGDLNPLYVRNPLTTETPIEYDGVKLPEYPRDNIVYSCDLGQGHFGVVVQAEARGIASDGSQTTVAVKVLKVGASTQIKKEFFREAALMQAFDHPNILKLIGVCIEQEPLCMIFEFMERGDLNNFLRKNTTQPAHPGLSAEQLVELCIDIAAGLEYLAQNHFVHRDLATRNCLVSSTYRVKISDFGLSQDIYSSDYFTLADTELLPIRWMPPEAILYSKFTIQSDVWSFGVVLWEIFSFGIQPYYTMTNEEVVQHVRDANVMSCPENCPRELYDLMIDCWAMNPSDRPTAAELHLGLRRWSPNLSALLQVEQKTVDYQNMAVVREYAQQNLEPVAMEAVKELANEEVLQEMNAGMDTEDHKGSENQMSTTLQEQL